MNDINSSADKGLTLDELIREHAGNKIEYPQEPLNVPMPGPASGVKYEEKHKEITRETAQSAGKQIAGLVVSGAETACGLIGKEKPSKYAITAGQRKDLSEAYADVAEYYGMGTTNPLFNAIILTILILSAPFKEAFSDRRIKKIEEEQKRQADEISKHDEDIKMMEAKLRMYEDIQKSKSEGKEELKNDKEN